MKKLRLASLAAILMSLFFVSWVFAQVESLTLKLSRDWGYGGFNGDIQGLYSMRVTGPADMAQVEYYIDAIKIGVASQSPYNLQFNTDNYPLGLHKLFAIGYSSGGQQYRSNEITANFVPKQSLTKTILPILGLVLAAILLSALVPVLAVRGKRLRLPLGTERNYGAGGGGICPKCHRPFALHFFSARLGIFRLTACPFCGKWSLIRIESITKLRQAEKAELEWVKTEMVPEPSDDANLRKEIDDSKYQGL